MKIEKIKSVCKSALTPDYYKQIIECENNLRKRKALSPVCNLDDCNAFFELFKMYILFDEIYSEIHYVLWQSEDE